MQSQDAAACAAAASRLASDLHRCLSEGLGQGIGREEKTIWVVLVSSGDFLGHSLFGTSELDMEASEVCDWQARRSMDTTNLPEVNPSSVPYTTLHLCIRIHL